MQSLPCTAVEKWVVNLKRPEQSRRYKKKKRNKTIVKLYKDPTDPEERIVN